MYLTARDFLAEDSNSGASGIMHDNGGHIKPSSASSNLYASFQLPLGYRANSVVVYGNNTSSNFNVYTSDVDIDTSTEVGTTTAINSTVSLSGQYASKGTYWTIKCSSLNANKHINGAKIILERVTAAP